MSILRKGTATGHRNRPNTIYTHVHTSYVEYFTFECYFHCQLIFGVKSAYTALVDSYVYVSMSERYYTIVSGEHVEETMLCRRTCWFQQDLLQGPRTKLVSFGDRSFNVIGRRLRHLLPMNTKFSGTLSMFKQPLKARVFKA